MAVRHLISSDALGVAEWDGLFELYSDIISRPGDYTDACRGKLMASLFYEPSTRTSFSFQAAMMRLGGGVFGFSDPSVSSHSKGETLADTVRICAAYSDLIVMRSPIEGSALAASLYSEVPVINAGDGGHMHPTQTLTDLATIATKRGKIEDLRIGLCGDLRYGRTVHSLITALAKFPGIRFFLISPRDLSLPQYMLDYLRRIGSSYIEVTGLDAILPQLDVLYMTRVQKERFTDPLEYERLKNVYILDRHKLERAKPDMLVMHPLPRVDEISRDVDSDPRAVYFEQARCGMYIRMALLLTLSRLPRISPALPEPGAHFCTNPGCVANTETYLPALETPDGNGRRCAFCDSGEGT